MLRLAFDFIITWRETRTRPNAYVLHTDCTLPLCKLIRYPSSVPGEMEAVIFPDSYFQPFTNP